MKHHHRCLAATALIALASGVIAPIAAASIPAAVAQPADPAIPGAGELFDRYIKALGGETAIRNIKSRVIIGSMVAKGAEAQVSQLTTRQIAPDKLLAIMEMGGSGPREVGYDGKVGWRRFAGGPAEPVSADALKQLKQTADIYQEANYKQRYKEMQTVGKAEFASRVVWEVRAVDQDDKPSTLYFDIENGLLLGARHEQVGPSGTVQVTMTLSDYKEFGGVKHATRIVQSAGGQEVTITYSEIKINPPDIGVIEAPAELAPKK
ncbi:MAG: hypothetical protein IT436_06715 [Phycisphaerales bacterium]|nr:hypothetical protein [Phycisphaerales bacterium]